MIMLFPCFYLVFKLLLIVFTRLAICQIYAKREDYITINHPKENSLPKKRGRKPKENLRDYNDEIKRLKMENQLLRDFLSLIGKTNY